MSINRIYNEGEDIILLCICVFYSIKIAIISHLLDTITVIFNFNYLRYLNIRIIQQFIISYIQNVLYKLCFMVYTKRFILKLMLKCEMID
jgi:hypothetical protein